MMGWLLAGVLGASILAFFASRARRYGRLFATEHFIEIARACGPLRAAAIARADYPAAESAVEQGDPRTFLSHGPLIVVYTARALEEHVVHHLSVSVPGRVTTGAAGTTFIAWLAMVLGWPIDEVVLSVAPSTVHHAELRVTRAEHARIAASPLLEVTPANVDELRRACLEARSRIIRPPSQSPAPARARAADPSQPHRVPVSQAMAPSFEQVATICRIAHDHSLRPEGKSLRELLMASNYRQLRPDISAEILCGYLADHPEVVTQWSMYSEDKRTSGGWYFLNYGRAGTVGRLGPRATRIDERHYGSAVEACAHYILEELDFWAGLGAG